MTLLKTKPTASSIERSKTPHMRRVAKSRLPCSQKQTFVSALSMSALCHKQAWPPIRTPVVRFFARKQTKRCNQLRVRLNSLLGAMFFPVCNEKFPVRIAGNSSRKSRVSIGLCRRGGAFQGKFPVFSRRSGNFRRAETRSLRPPSTATLSICYRTILCLSGTRVVRRVLKLSAEVSSRRHEAAHSLLDACMAVGVAAKMVVPGSHMLGFEQESLMPVCFRYIVRDVDAAIEFYTKQLAFKLEMHPAPPFAEISRGDMHLYLTQPGGIGGGSPMAIRRTAAPGGWNTYPSDD